MGSSGSSSSPPPVPNPQEQANALVQAQLSSYPQAAQLSYDILSNPQYGLLPTSQLYENVRRQVYPGETAVREQLRGNILQNLISPTGITPEQQSALNERRGLAQNELVQAMRGRANLGGGLYGGRSAQAEQRAVGELQGQFAESDIGREERSRLNAIQAALPFLQ